MLQKAKTVLFFLFVVALLVPQFAFAATPYDTLVDIADLSGLSAMQLTLLGVIITMSLITTAAVIIIGLLRKGRAAGR
jgi:hypothetical protein